MNLAQMQHIVNSVKFEKYELFVKESGHGYTYLQATYREEDVTQPGVEVAQFTRRWMLTPEMSESEVVSTAFKCALTSMDHKTREWFTYEGVPVFHPHQNVRDLIGLYNAGRNSKRPKGEETEYRSTGHDPAESSTGSVAQRLRKRLAALQGGRA